MLFSWTIDTACSGGLVGVDAACQYLRARKISGAVVAAANLWMSPEHTQELGTMRAAYSATGKCHTFDAKADGYCRAEAVNAVYLKRLSDAIEDGDPIRAVIRGTANNSDGWTPGINSPSAEAQAAVIRAAYADAGIDSDHYLDTGYLECHGTGTPAGDPLELQGAASVLSGVRDPSQPLFIGSIKSNIGHSEPGAGISGLIKAMQVLEQGYIPGNPTFMTPNPNIDFEGLRVCASRPGFPWASKYRRASVNSFGYGGSNAHAVLDNADHFLRDYWPARGKDRPFVSSYAKPGELLSFRTRIRDRSSKVSLRRPQVLVFSANDEDSLEGQIKALSAHLLNPRVKIKMSDLAYTLSERRTRHFCRAFSMVFSGNMGHASVIPDVSTASGRVPDRKTKIGFVFTGQGAQWPQMGLELLKTFPKTVKPFLEELDGALLALPKDLRPSWSLLDELADDRSSDHFSKPEFSQPLVTALQLAQLKVFEYWNVWPRVVVGHSSGEIAAACSSGHLTHREAILIAYFRGLAARDALSAVPMGMMAVGLSATGLTPYLEKFPEKAGLVIACHNSPESITISGPVHALTRLLDPIKADGHLARMLRVEVAYHSFHLQEAASRYEKLINDHVNFEGEKETSASRKIAMVSSVTGKLITQDQTRTAAYWRDNMMSPVQFEAACRTLFGDANIDANFLIELGPSNALAGPVAQTVKYMGIESVKYVAASKRGQDSIHAIFDVAGQLFLHNAEISLERVNHNETVPEASVSAVIVDLPNYNWNHTSRYWYESVTSKEWRFKPFLEHDLLGSKVLGTLWQNPTWHKKLRLFDLPWLRDHRIGSEILFPAAGYIAMAVEAVRQAEFALTSGADKSPLNGRTFRYDLRNVEFSRGLVLEDDVEVDLMLTLAPTATIGRGWWEYRIMSLLASEMAAPSAPSPASWTENSSGLVRIQLDVDTQSPQIPPHVRDFINPMPAKLWHQTMEDVGYAYGPAFRTQLQFECMEGSPSSRALISLSPPSSRWEPQTQYPIHVSALDGCIQSVFPSLYNGCRSDFQTLLLPRRIDRMTLSSQIRHLGEAVALSTSKNGLSDTSVYDVDGKELIMDFKGLAFSSMSVQKSLRLSHAYAQVEWKPDFTHLNSDEKLQKALSNVPNKPELHVRELLNLAAHKAPNLKVLELSFDEESTQPLWLSDDAYSRSVRATCGEYHFASDNASTVLAVEQQMSKLSLGNARSSLLNALSEAFRPPPEVLKCDLVLVRHDLHGNESSLKTLLKNVHGLLVKGGSMIWYDTMHAHAPGRKIDNEQRVSNLHPALENAGFTKARQSSGGCIIAEVDHEQEIEKNRTLEDPINNNLALLRFLDDDSYVIAGTTEQLQIRGWDIARLSSNHDIERLSPKSTVLVLEEIARPLFHNISEDQWSTLQRLAQKECHLLWVTRGSQMEVTSPETAICHGVFRSLRGEAPMMHVTTLDLDPGALEDLTPHAIAVDKVLRMIQKAKSNASIAVEEEIAERGGLLYVSRIRADMKVNQFKDEEETGKAPLVMKAFHPSTRPIRLVTERPGDLEALLFVEGEHIEMLEPADVEVELHAMGCLSNDVAIALGNSSGTATQLGSEAAGVITRIGTAVDHRHVGQRVALLGRGCFANRTVVSAHATLPLPDNMAFTEAATLPVAFATAIHGLCDLARLQRNQRVLIDFDIGNMAFAFVQICQYLDCIVIVVVDKKEHQQVLVNEHGMDEDSIYLSPDSDCSFELGTALERSGVDVIVQKSAGSTSQHEYRRYLIPGGAIIRVQSGTSKSEKAVSMEPPITNYSLHSIDATALSVACISQYVLSFIYIAASFSSQGHSIFARLARLIDDGFAKPLPLHHVFRPSEAPSAFKMLRDGARIGKIVISEDVQDAGSVLVSRPVSQLV
jgi:acyl transferase domain-containing protein/NADPH:quinone reductase-like Zn-dependent oxidoreductase